MSCLESLNLPLFKPGAICDPSDSLHRASAPPSSDEQSEIATEKEKKQRVKPQRETSSSVVACQKAFMPLHCQWDAKVCQKQGPRPIPSSGRGRAACHSPTPLRRRSTPLLLPSCKTTCYQRVPLCYKDTTSKHIFTPNCVWVLQVELSSDCFQDKLCVKMLIFGLNLFRVASYSSTACLWCSLQSVLWLWLKLACIQNVFP